jgi:hypothetical protein
MENNTESTPHGKPLTDIEVFTHIWFSPRTVFKFINDTWYEKYMILLLCLGGIVRAFDRASTKNMGDHMSLGGIVAFCVIAGGLLGWISFYLYAALVSWTGKWLKGQGDTQSIMRILAYAMLPAISSLILLIPQIAVYGNELFKSNGDLTNTNELSNSIYKSTGLLEFVLAIWTIVLTVIGISEVQQLSIGKSILNVILPVFVIVIPLVLLVLLLKSIY